MPNREEGNQEGLWGNRALNGNGDLKNMTHEEDKSVENKNLTLKMAGLFTEENQKAFEGHKDSQSLAKVVLQLKKAGILNQEIFDALIVHSELSIIADVFQALNGADIDLLACREGFFSAVSAHKQLQSLAEALSVLRKAGTLNQANLDAIIKHPDPQCLAGELSAAGIGESPATTLSSLQDPTKPCFSAGNQYRLFSTSEKPSFPGRTDADLVSERPSSPTRP